MAKQNTELELKIAKASKGMTGKLISGILFLLLFFPIGVLILVFYFMQYQKVQKLKEQLE